MLDRILPRSLGNDYRGYELALWIFAVMGLMKLGLGLAHVFRRDGGAQSVSHIPLDTYPGGAAQNVVGIFARMGLEQLMLGVLFAVVLVRYRSMIPLMYTVAVLGQVGAFALASFKPLSLAAPSGARNVHRVIAGLSIAGLVLSLSGPGYATPEREARGHAVQPAAAPEAAGAGPHGRG